MAILLFGDQTSDQTSFLKSVAIQKDNSILANFIERSTALLRDESQKLPYHRRQKIPQFLRLSELLSGYQDAGQKVPELEGALTTIAQIAWYIR